MPDCDKPTFAELVREFLSSTERGYDLLAPKFDCTPFKTPDSLLEAAAAAVGGPRSVGAALDVCCGTGAAMAAFLPLCRQRMVGLDRSAGMLAVAGEKLRSHARGPCVEFVRADALAMPFVPAFDLAVSFGALGHIEARDQPRFVREIAGALKPGGRFVTLAPREARPKELWFWGLRAFNLIVRVRNALLKPPFIMYYGHYSWPRMKRLLEDGGFRVEVRDIGLAKPYHGFRLIIATLPRAEE